MGKAYRLNIRLYPGRIPGHSEIVEFFSRIQAQSRVGVGRHIEAALIQYLRAYEEGERLKRPWPTTGRPAGEEIADPPPPIGGPLLPEAVPEREPPSSGDPLGLPGTAEIAPTTPLASTPSPPSGLSRFDQLCRNVLTDLTR